MTAAMHFTVDTRQLRAKAAQAIASVPKTLDRFVKRGAGELAQAEKKEAPKALTILANGIQVQQNRLADYTVVPTMRYAAAVNNGARPHWAPLQPLKDWLRVTKRVTDPWELHERAKGLQRFIAAHGTKANPFVQRARASTDDRVIALLREGVHTAMTKAFGA